MKFTGRTRTKPSAASHYSNATLPDQQDEFAWFGKTHAVTALATLISSKDDESHPFGL
ncbi:hypothetical protein [uncultured Tateyamaria sp.]|uniref:hypothetical protein n=1 Tax=uncultured Tateyamaria sp. TaxID=455651 RepID=UPI00260C2ACF|nr:hypothetical protein [uncultured Tateyamaria sp.]